MKRTASQTPSGPSRRKHDAIRQAGTEIFLRLGYGNATMDLVAAEAGVSKQTVYNHFQSKEGLFKAIIEDQTTRLMAPLVLPDRADAPPERVLSALGRDFLGLMLRPGSLALYRLIVAESDRFPELGSATYEFGTGRLLAMLADYLARETRHGRLSVAEPGFAAEQFVGMLTGRMQLRALLGVGPTPGAAALKRHAERTAAAFLALYARQPRPIPVEPLRA
ncbi:MAG: TetR/AcrR family transcriptional regulator [Tistlia sp.]|uniref:TetR/AcrR family transcriptional regulator n=1 Tax=Tistlia sp. TaxID=3057121 RepID=UPI0034A5464E